MTDEKYLKQKYNLSNLNIKDHELIDFIYTKKVSNFEIYHEDIVDCQCKICGIKVRWFLEDKPFTIYIHDLLDKKLSGFFIITDNIPTCNEIVIKNIIK